MGTSTILDIMGSFIIGGIILLMLQRTMAASNESLYVNCSDLITQLNLVELVSLLEYDFEKIGYCENWKNMPAPTASILNADTSSIKFLTDVDRDGDMDELRYYLGDPAELSVTPNPNDRMLYRVVNNETPYSANLGVTEFRIVYYSPLGDTLPSPVANCTQIASMELNLRVENTSGYDNQYKFSIWRQFKLASKNLRNR